METQMVITEYFERDAFCIKFNINHLDQLKPIKHWLFENFKKTKYLKPKFDYKNKIEFTNEFPISIKTKKCQDWEPKVTLSANIIGYTITIYYEIIIEFKNSDDLLLFKLSWC